MSEGMRFGLPLVRLDPKLRYISPSGRACQLVDVDKAGQVAHFVYVPRGAVQPGRWQADADGFALRAEHWHQLTEVL